MVEIDILEPEEGLTDLQLEQIDQTVGRPVPQDLRQLLKRYNGGMPDRSNCFIDRANIPGLQTSISVEYLLSAEEMAQVVSDYRNRIPTNLVPFGDDGAGNYICIGNSGPTEGAIYFWDHEVEGLRSDLQETAGRIVTLIADSLDQFLAKLTTA